MEWNGVMRIIYSWAPIKMYYVHVLFFSPFSTKNSLRLVHDLITALASTFHGVNRRSTDSEIDLQQRITQ